MKRNGKTEDVEEVQKILEKIHSIHGYEKIDDQTIDLSSTIYAVKPGMDLQENRQHPAREFFWVAQILRLNMQPRDIART